MDDNTRKSNGYAFVTVPKHIMEKLMKLNDLEFTGKNLVIEEAKKNLLKRRKCTSKQDLKVLNNQKQDLVTPN